MSATYWQASVMVDRHTKVSFARDTLESAIADGIQNAIYYRAIYPESNVVVTDLREGCANCHNEGTVCKLARGGARVKCPSCRGKLPAGALADIPLIMPGTANRIVLRQA